MNAITLRRFILCLILLLLTFPAPAGPLEDANKKIVLDFFNLAFNQHQPAEAARKYLGPEYIQHNPYAANGPGAFSAFFESYFRSNPNYHVTIARMIAEGDLVVVHSNAKSDPAGRGTAVVDILRVENGRIVEHWDVVQAVPSMSANTNSMF